MVLGDFHKAIVIIIEFCFIAIGQYLSDGFSASEEASVYIIVRNVVTGAFLSGTLTFYLATPSEQMTVE